MEEHSYSDPAEFPKFSRRRRCCGHRVQLVLVGLATTLLWAGLLALLLFWREDTLGPMLSPSCVPSQKPTFQPRGAQHTPWSPISPASLPPCPHQPPPKPLLPTLESSAPRPAPLSPALSTPPAQYAQGLQPQLTGGLWGARTWKPISSPPLLSSPDWDTVQNLKQLEVTAARNVSRVAKDLERHNGDRMAQKAQAAQVSQNMEEIQAEQKRMKAQDSELSRSLEGLRSDLSNLKSLSLNERHTALHSLERLQEEVVKLWIELHTSNARTPGVTPGEMLPHTLPIEPTVPATAPATVSTTAPATVPATASTTVPATASTTVPAMVSAMAPATVPATASTMVPTMVSTTAPAMAPATAYTTVPATASTTVPTTAPATASTTMPTTVPATAAPLSLSSTPGSLCNMCPEKWVNFQRKCYYFGEGPKRWIQARFACSKLRGRLVSIHSQEEQDFLVRHANRKGTWIGLRDLDREGEFIWMDQGPLNYSNWRPGEPNNGGQGEDCVMMQGSGEWNDAFCGSRLDGWVCDRLATC